mgnify:CR=1 FL=1
MIKPTKTTLSYYPQGNNEQTHYGEIDARFTNEKILDMMIKHYSNEGLRFFHIKLEYQNKKYEDVAVVYEIDLDNKLNPQQVTLIRAESKYGTKTFNTKKLGGNQ